MNGELSPSAIRVLICDLCKQAYDLGWVSGTGGGICIRNGDNVFMAPSGVQKERLKPEHIFALDLDANVVERSSLKNVKVSACSPLFFAAIRHGNAGAVLHSHSKAAVLVSLLFSDFFICKRLEMLKGIAGYGYNDILKIPIIENTAHEPDLLDTLTDAIKRNPNSPAVIVRRHGVYVWGKDWQQTKVHAECLDYLFSVTVDMHRMGLSNEIVLAK